MPDPASGSAAGAAALTVTSGSLFGLGALMPPGASFNEFIWGCVFSAVGAAAYQFICAQAARQQAADKGVPVNERPKIYTVMLGYSIFGSMLAAACTTYIVHKLGGSTGFGDTNFAQSSGVYMVGGAAGPKLVFKVVGGFTALIGSIKFGAGK